jgi:hypothetical protein
MIGALKLRAQGEQACGRQCDACLPYVVLTCYEKQLEGFGERRGGGRVEEEEQGEEEEEKGSASMRAAGPYLACTREREFATFSFSKTTSSSAS